MKAAKATRSSKDREYIKIVKKTIADVLETYKNRELQQESTNSQNINGMNINDNNNNDNNIFFGLYILFPVLYNFSHVTLYK